MMGLLTARRYASYWMIGLLALAATVAVCLCVGSDYRNHWMVLGYPSDPVKEVADQILDFRIRRVAQAAICGWALAASGVALQALLRNALADPYVLGISGGGTLGVMAWLMAVGSTFANPLMSSGAAARTWLQVGATVPAMIGAGGSCLVVYLLARGRRGGGQMDPLTLLLVGVVVSAISGALIMLLNHFAPGNVIKDLMKYMMGTISDDWNATGLMIAGAAVVAGWLPLVFSAKALNVSTLSDVEVAGLGVRIGLLRTVVFFCATLMTAVSIAIAGPIGFVGLICPHICRSLFGADHRQLMVTAPFCGAVVLMLADSFVRSTPMTFGGELPVGVITALAGGPVFLVLLLRRGRGAIGGGMGGVSDGN